MPGDITVRGRCESQRHYQQLGQFIRKHQREMVNMPPDERFSRINTINPGYHRLLRLSIPHEPLYVRGWIDNFAITKRGVHDPAPEYSFNFFVVFDQSARDIGISHRIQKYYNAADSRTGSATEPFHGTRDSDYIGSMPTDFAPGRRGGA
jgi:hypothetical protein